VLGHDRWCDRAWSQRYGDFCVTGSGETSERADKIRWRNEWMSI
jgi:hypothetical protein